MTNTQTHAPTPTHITKRKNTGNIPCTHWRAIEFLTYLEQSYSETDLFYNPIWNAARLDERFLTAAVVHNDRPSSRV